MATRKPTPKKAAPKKKKRNAKKKSRAPRFRINSVLLLVSGLVVFTALGFLLLFRPSPTDQASAPTSPAPLTGHAKRPIAKPYQEPRPSPPPIAKVTPAPPPPAAEKIVPGHTKPMAAIVIDDMGHNRRIGTSLIGLDLDLSFAFLPYAPHTKVLLRKALQKRRAILLHQPMEPSQNKWDPGPNALYLDMSRQELRQAFRKNLGAIPMAIGINNHMGSRFTENWRAMEIFLLEAKRENLFFLDSVTSSYSVGHALAAQLGIKTARRDIFIDNVQDPAQIENQLRALVQVAKQNGQAIAIGHPYQATLDALRNQQKQLAAELTLVGVETLVR